MARDGPSTSGAVGVLGPDLAPPPHAALTALYVDPEMAASVNQVLAAVLRSR
ncbi:hypothetical protein [Amycolatopsis sp. cmx-4-61]|uniref:hypothetical protein n=1 Tax=Amycolatopsis sp. cmx-4-61 TaxID=2790937 RepID=UPI00397935D8